MAIKEKTRIFSVGGSKVANIPATLRTDSAYPFKNEDDELVIEIRGKELIIRQKNTDETFD